MTQSAIDTLRFAKRLKEGGFSGDQAEAMAEAVGTELNGTVRDRNLALGEVRVLKWAAGFALACMVGSLALLYEGQSGLIDQVARVDGRMGEIAEQLAGLNGQIAHFDELIDRQDERLSRQDERLSRQDERLDRQDEQLSRQDERLDRQDEQLSRQGQQLDHFGELLDRQDERLDRQDERFDVIEDLLRTLVANQARAAQG